MTAAEAESNDSVAWVLTFTPSNHLYQFRNVATGHLLTYSSTGFGTVERTNPSTADGMQLMKGRVDVTSDRLRGYWIIHPETYNWSPRVLSASSATAVTSGSLNLDNASTAQRWLILDAQQMRKVNEAADGIELVNTNETLDDPNSAIYDLQGRRTTTPDKPGIYIRNGRKYVVK
jgi:hypothetical protein